MSVQATGAGLWSQISGHGTSGGQDPQRVSDLLRILASCGVGRVAEATDWPLVRDQTATGWAWFLTLS